MLEYKTQNPDEVIITPPQQAEGSPSTPEFNMFNVLQYTFGTATLVALLLLVMALESAIDISAQEIIGDKYNKVCDANIIMVGDSIAVLVAEEMRRILEESCGEVSFSSTYTAGARTASDEGQGRFGAFVAGFPENHAQIVDDINSYFTKNPDGNIIISFGYTTNDAILLIEPQHAIDELIAGISAILNEVDEDHIRQISIILAPPPPINAHRDPVIRENLGYDTAQLSAIIENVNSLQQLFETTDFGDQLGVNVTVVNSYNQYLSEEIEGIRVSSEDLFPDDGTHPNEQGAELIANALFLAMINIENSNLFLSEPDGTSISSIGNIFGAHGYNSSLPEFGAVINLIGK